MGIDDLKKHVDEALSKCEKTILNHPNVVMSEADFERLLCKCISDEIKENLDIIPDAGTFSVHTQISHYIHDNGKYKVGERVDILLLDESLLESCRTNRKKKYSGVSIAFELKYLHVGDSVKCVDEDFKKWERLKEDSSLYVVVLLEAKSKEKFQIKKEKIKKIEMKYNGTKQNGINQLKCCVIMKGW